MVINLSLVGSWFRRRVALRRRSPKVKGAATTGRDVNPQCPLFSRANLSFFDTWFPTFLNPTWQVTRGAAKYRAAPARMRFPPRMQTDVLALSE
jgi:hypothetical protein